MDNLFTILGGSLFGLPQQAQQQQYPSWYLAGIQPQQQAIFSAYGTQGSPFDLNSQAYRNWQENRRQYREMYESMAQPNSEMYGTPRRRHVESREVTPRERARKQINGAVQAVKDAQLAAKSK